MEPTPPTLRVLADELLERGELHGEFIQLQCERAERGGPAGPREQELRSVIERRLAELLALGPLAAPRFRWRFGLLDAIDLELDDPLTAQLERLRGWPHAQALRSLSLTAGHVAADLGDFLAACARLTFPSVVELRVLTGESFLGRPRVDLQAGIGDVRPLCTHWPQLEVLELHGVGHELAALRFPRLRRFAASSLQPAAIPALVEAHWPKLEELELTFALTPAEAEPVFGALLDAPMSDALRSVCIRSPWPEFFRAALPRSRLGRGRAVQVD